MDTDMYVLFAVYAFAAAARDTLGRLSGWAI
jgi:hypothetical protein